MPSVLNSDKNGRTRTNRLHLEAGLIACLILAIGACQMPSSGEQSGGGSLSISVSADPSRTLVPSLDMNPASYEITGSGPAGSTFSKSTTGASITIGGLAFGSWSVTANAKNAANTVIGHGTKSATVDTGKVTTVALTVTPLQGIGTLKLTANWPTAYVLTPSIDAQLLPLSGAAIALPFTLGTGTATCENSSLQAGYSTLTLKLLDNGQLVMGAVEVVRIVQGQITSGTFDFSQVNSGVQPIAISITPVMSDPLTVSLTGQSATLALGSSMTVTAATTAYTGNVTYVWYVNGESKATGSNASPSFTVGSALAAGVYRLDVTAISADGMRAGAATTSFRIQ